MSTSAQLVHSLDKTARKAYYLGEVSLLLLKILRSRSKRKRKKMNFVQILGNNDDLTEDDVINHVARIVGEWREFLLWLEEGLTLVSLVMKGQGIELILTESQVQVLINATKTMRIIMKSIHSIINFAILSKVLAKKAMGVAFNRYTIIFWIAGLFFVVKQLQDIWPQLETQAVQLWGILSTTITFLRGPLKQYFLELLQDIEETNPELFAKLQGKLQNIDKMIMVPKLIVQKSSQIFQLSSTMVKPLVYQYLIPPMQNILIKSYQTYLLSKQLSPSDVLSLVSSSEWPQEFIKSLQKYLFWMLSLTSKPVISKL